MKKIASILISIITMLSMLTCCIPFYAYAADNYEYWYYHYYEADNDNDNEIDTEFYMELDFKNFTVDISDIYTTCETLEIPETIKVNYEYYDTNTWDYFEKTGTFTVTSISGLSDTDNLKEITIPYTVESIEDYAIGYQYYWHEQIDNFKIICTQNTAGERYAKNNGFKYFAYKNIASANITLSETSFDYTGTAIKPDVTVKYNSKLLTLNTDYTISYSKNTNSGTAIVTIKGIGDYRGINTASFTINPISADGATVNSIATQYYTGKAIKPSPVVKLNGKTLKVNTDYKLSYSSNTKIGTGYVTITFCGNYTGSKKVSFKITVAKITNFKVSSSSATSLKLTWTKAKCDKYYLYKYDSKTKKYKLLKKLTTNSYTDKKLTQFTKYSYKIKAVITLDGKTLNGSTTSLSSYTKLTTPSLTLATKNKAVNVKWSKNSKATGYQIYRSVDYGDFKKLKTIKGAKTVSFNNTKLSNSKYYYYKVRAYKTVSGKTYYSNFSTIRCSKDDLSILNGATLKSHSSFKVYNKQGKKTTSYTVQLSKNDIKILKNFASKNFKKGMTREDKLRVTLDWIHSKVKYATGSDWNKIANKSWVDAIFTYKKGQCAQYNGAMAAMMVYLGYDAYIIQGYRGTYKGNHWQHFWCEVNINGTKYLMETGNKKDGDWWYFLTPYKYTSGYIMNCKDV
ncbi:MAG: hypothetical protein K2K01_07255 [Eubacterium sp.]|nr:hypothetical protein [Eubacterium sp.]